LFYFSVLLLCFLATVTVNKDKCKILYMQIIFTFKTPVILLIKYRTCYIQITFLRNHIQELQTVKLVCFWSTLYFSRCGLKPLLKLVLALVLVG